VILKIIASLSLLPAPSLAQTPADLATVQQRLESGFLASIPATTTVEGSQSTLLADGTWFDIPYTSITQTNWAPLTHLDRLGLMCRAWSHPSGSLHQDPALLADILKAYDAWISKNPQSSNWWYNQIAVPQELGESMVLLKEQLSPARLSSGLAILQRAYVARSTNSGTNTGQNRVDRAIAGIQRGIVAGSTAITQDAFLAIADTILVTTAEGIQRDGSFHQHGAQLYNQGYGSLYISDTLKWASMGADTGFAFSETKRRILADYLLDGTRWLNRGQAIDYTASGRGISRKGQSANGSGLGSLATNSLQITPGYRETELDTLRASITAANSTGSADPALAFTGGKHFWRSDLTAWHRPAAYASVKISSTRTLQPETGNGEGLKNYHLADGVNLIYRSGNEYDDIMPAWNWRKLPGTTVEQGTYSLKPAADWGVAGTSTYAGGISDGTYAATAFRYSRRNVAARKAWFFFDHAFVALGADIDAPSATSQVETTLNQSLLNGPVTYRDSTTTRTLPTGSSTLSGLQWVHHDGTGYFFNQVPASATLQAAAQSGTWQSLNTGYDTTSVSKNVFALSIRHGTAFSNATYAYTVAPGLSAAGMEAWQNPIAILRNDATAQAARDESAGVTECAFYAAGSVDLGDGRSLSSDSPSLLMLHSGEGSLKVAVASPESKAMTVQVQATGLKLAAEPSWRDAFGATTTVSLGLPGGDLAGSTVALDLTVVNDAEPTVSFTASGGATALAATFAAPLALPGNTTVTADAMALSFPEPVSGAASLSKTGTATLDLSGANTYGGGTFVQGGVINLSGDQSAADGGWQIGPAATNPTTVNLASGSALVVSADASVRIANTSASGTATQTLNVAGNAINHGSLYLGRPAAMNLQSGGTWTQSGPASINAHGGYRSEMTVGNGSTFIYDGSGNFELNPANGNSGPAILSVAGGTFITSRGCRNAIATSSAAASITLSAGGTLKIIADIPDFATTAGSPFLFQIGSGAKFDTNGFSTVITRPVSDAPGQTGSLTKNGSGTLALTAANTYSGNTTVNAGTLALASASLGDSSELAIASGASLALEHAATDTIRVLRFDGVPQAAGLWGGPGSAATHRSPRLSGSGLLQVTTGGFDLWLANHPALAAGGEDGDPDGDRWANLFEYALGLDPFVPDAPPAPVHGDGKLLMTFRRPQAAPDIEIIPEWSDDLSEWSGEGITSDESASPVIRLSLPDAGDRRFLRLRAGRR
jgi:chondroitin AC lyase